MGRLFLLCVVAFWVVRAASAEMRVWTSVKGDTIEAEYMRDTSGKVWLKPAKGKTKAVPISALCEEDRIYILKQKPPKIKIEVDDDVDRGTVGSDIDNVRENIRITVEIEKTSKAPYPTEYEVLFFVVAENIRY